MSARLLKCDNCKTRIDLQCLLQSVVTDKVEYKIFEHSNKLPIVKEQLNNVNIKVSFLQKIKLSC